MIDLCAGLSDWARFSTTKGAIKLHLLLDHDGYLPSFACVTPGIVADLTIGRTMNLPSGSILIIDRGFTDYDWFADLTQQGVFFVMRLKKMRISGCSKNARFPEKFFATKKFDCGDWNIGDVIG